MNILANATGATTKLPTGTKSLATGKSSGMDTSGDDRTIPYIAPPIIAMNITGISNTSAVNMLANAFLKRYKNTIEKIIEKDIVQDAIDRALSYSNLAENRNDYITYFQASPYVYIRNKLSSNASKLDNMGMLTKLFEHEEAGDIVFERVVTDTYKNKLEEVYYAVCKYKGQEADPRDYKATSEQVAQNNQAQKLQMGGGEEAQEGSKKSNTPMIILAVAVLAVIFILKKKKRG